MKNMDKNAGGDGSDGKSGVGVGLGGGGSGKAGSSASGGGGAGVHDPSALLDAASLFGKCWTQRITDFYLHCFDCIVLIAFCLILINMYFFL